MNTRNRLSGLAWVASLSILGCAVLAGGVARAEPIRKCTNKTAFRLPVRIAPAERSRLQEVQLYVREGAAGTWHLDQKAPPDKTEFVCHVPHEGEFWFRLVTVSVTNQMNPPDISKVEPALIVVVDLRAPECEVKAVTGPAGELVLQCDVHDNNPDFSKTKLEFQASDRTWMPLPVVAGKPGWFQVPDPGMIRGPVRATCLDQAGNGCTREFNVMPQQGTQAAMGNPGAPIVQATATMATALPTETLSEKPAAPVDNVVTQLVNGKHVTMEYQFDSPNPGRVVVWVSADGGQSWYHLCDDADRKTPVEFDLPGEGRYGVCVAACAMEGEPVPPARGATPDCWVEVDLTKPAAAILAVRQGEPGTLLITWTASDKNLKSEPIDVYYSRTVDGPWQVIAHGLKNDGNYRWHYPTDLTGDVFIRLEATDRAGNVTRCNGPQAASNSSPRAKILGVAASGTSAN